MKAAYKRQSVCVYMPSAEALAAPDEFHLFCRQLWTGFKGNIMMLIKRIQDRYQMEYSNFKQLLHLQDLVSVTSGWRFRCTYSRNEASCCVQMQWNESLSSNPYLQCWLSSAPQKSWWTVLKAALQLFSFSYFDEH